MSKETTYLGVVLDYKLNWSRHLKHACEKVEQANWACMQKSLIQINVGLEPDRVRWLYTAVLGPRLVYRVAAW